jgi:DNA-directed RNA polymerase specialized sigma24 family protein
VLGDGPAAFDDDPAGMLAVDDALTRLEYKDPLKGEIILLRYFAGLTIDETAKALGISPRKVNFEWRFARAWLHRELRADD